jgi:membrane protein
MSAPTVSDEAHRASYSAKAPMAFGIGGWWRVVKRTAATMGQENLSLIAAGCAFYALLAIAPTLGALTALYGLFSDPADIARHLEALEEIAPPAAYDIVRQQAEALSSTGRRALGLGSLAALLFAVWTARLGVRALMTGVVVAYREPSDRGFLKETAITYLLTLSLVILGAVTLGAIVGVPAVLAFVPFGDTVSVAASVLRWPLGLIAVLLGLGMIYRYAPDRRSAKTSWLTPGAIVAVLLWLGGSIAFTIYLARFANYNETYGTLGAVAALLMWLWLTAMATLIGAVFNAECELETAEDTTIGTPRAMGERGAHVADHVADG